MAGVSEVTSCRWAFNESTDINISKEGRWRESTIEIVNINIKKQLLIFTDSLHQNDIINVVLEMDHLLSLFLLHMLVSVSSSVPLSRPEW
jgi:hypothetical protein